MSLELSNESSDDAKFSLYNISNGHFDSFDTLSTQIRELRTSEERLYRKVLDLLKQSDDYDPTNKRLNFFFSKIQNKLLYAVTEQTAAEIIVSRSNADFPNMGLVTWKEKAIHKTDVVIAKNYLTLEELDVLKRLTFLFLETVDLDMKSRNNIETVDLDMKNRSSITLDYWLDKLDKFLLFNEKPILRDNGKITKKQAETVAHKHYEAFIKSHKNGGRLLPNTRPEST